MTKLSVALIREAMAERTAMIRAHALAYIEQHGTAYSREIYDAIVQRPDGVDVRVQHVGAELRALETEGLLDSWLAPAKTMMRRYYRRVRVLLCPKCGEPHVDEGEWARRIHHKHLCLNEACGHTFRRPEYVFGVAPRGE